MNQLLVAASLAGALALPALITPTAANASCSDRKVAGTVLGGVGGALIGHAIAGGAAATVLGGIGGAVVGHEIAGSGCRRSRPTAYYRSDDRYPLAAQGRAVRYVYYDQYGNPVSEGPVPAATTPTAYAGSPACRNETQSYYDARGALQQQPVQVCVR